MSILDEIVTHKKKEVANRLYSIKAADLNPNSNDTRVPLDFASALQSEGLSLIAEVKKASPSKGLIRKDFNPFQIADSYQRAGADCISVLTEEEFFQGHNDYLVGIKKKTSIPLLRKDFIVDPRQIRESYDLGADAILLIVSILTDGQLSEFMNIAKSFGLHCLVETHSEEEMSRAINLNCQIIGVNNRNLATFATDISHSIHMKKRIPDNVICVSESGIHSAQDCELLYQSGFDAVLVGEILMRQNDPGKFIHSLLGRIDESS